MLRLPARLEIEAALTDTTSPTHAEREAWKNGLPALRVEGATLRELKLSDAPTLLAMLTTDEVARFISPPPTTVEGFERFIAWTHGERQAGRLVCFGIVPDGLDTAVGLVQVRALAPAWRTCEWGFAIGSAFWGTGLFVEAARTVVSFVFAVLGAHRIEARACVENARGNGVLRKLGAAREGHLRGSFKKHGVARDQYLWAITSAGWAMSKCVWGYPVH